MQIMLILGIYLWIVLFIHLKNNNVDQLSDFNGFYDSLIDGKWDILMIDDIFSMIFENNILSKKWKGLTE